MRIAVLGTGVVGQTLAATWQSLGHDVVIGTRDPAASLGRREPNAMGGPGFGVWAEAHPGIRVATLPEAAAHGELVVNATSGHATLAALAEAGAENLDGKVLLDLANPLDFSQGFPPTLTVKETDSLAEQVQRAFPGARVVKSLNTMNAAVMVAPESLGDGDSSVFVSGDDAAAKDVVSDLLRQMGWRDVVDLGDLSSARGTEMMMPMWLRLLGAFGHANFNIRVVR